MLRHRGQEGVEVRARPDDAEIGLAVQHPAHALAHDQGIVGKNDTQ